MVLPTAAFAVAFAGLLVCSFARLLVCSFACLLDGGCGGLNILGPRSSTIMRCGVVRVAVSLWAWALRLLS